MHPSAKITKAAGSEPRTSNITLYIYDYSRDYLNDKRKVVLIVFVNKIIIVKKNKAKIEFLTFIPTRKPFSRDK